MSTKFIRFVAVLAILVSIVGITGVARADPAGEKTAAAASSSTSPSISPWLKGWADENTSVHLGYYPSIAYNPADGLPYISYYDAVLKNLMLTSPTTSASNCGDNNLWWCRVVDGNSSLSGKTNGDVGQFSSIAFWSGTIGILPGWKLGISYHDASNHALKVAVWTQTALGGSWKYTIIASTDNSVHSGNEVGTYTSLKFSSGGTPYIAYYSHLYSTFLSNYIGSLYLARQVASGGNCGVGADAGKWQCDTIEFSPGTGMGLYASLGLGYNNVPYMSYYDAFNGDLKYAHYDGPGTGDCYSGSDYSCMTIDSTGNVGLFTSLTAPRSSTDKPRIAYYDKTNGELKYAIPSASGQHCVAGWYCEAIRTIGANLTQVGISMALDDEGRPIIAYQDASNDPGPAVLSVARPNAASGVLIGNCGDGGGGLFFDWVCDYVDNAAYGIGNVSLADYTAVAVSPNGLATIAYLETDSYNNTDHLKVAYQRLQVFLPLIIR